MVGVGENHLNRFNSLIRAGDSSKRNDEAAGAGKPVISPANGMQVLISVILQQKADMTINSDIQTIAFDMLTRQGEALTEMGKLFLDMLIKTADAAQKEDEAIKIDNDFFEQKAQHKRDLEKRSVANIILTQENTRRETLRRIQQKSSFAI
ncbi:hypothetical protein [Pseudochelatococcus sp. G4_1912]|uniref:hypothetical protein n=1 Tax=Pseudochelatococcus sp. G4_1912 TaxID=3114288 RepID=UPI0039C6E201